MKAYLDQYPFIAARHFTTAHREGADLVVIHTMEAPEKPGTAEAVARWFGGAQAPQASAHFCVDNDSAVQCVRLTDVAWHAPGANRNGIGIEHAGYASQGAEQWADDYSEEMLRRSARLCAELCRECGIPVRRVTADDLKAGGARGICGHHDATLAFRKSTHTDPGPRFPWLTYLAMVEQYFTGEELDALDTPDRSDDPDTDPDDLAPDTPKDPSVA